ncbi:bifunctional phosphoribosyl-AMP cyclohydrolase/phosphoribosyl-ATP diphosphatase HisIE [Buchnera aphidicola]|uniref:bifunctional phosphoribosyl-AMP cyclohydrolase/phosphoribosyl-ATP diphosphatase HisIE n=1 Tax=Buchnera aphidicola TaxID=9 RepID=UPI0031B83F5B
MLSIFKNIKIDWKKVNGMIPVIVQNIFNGKVLMLAYMNRKAFNKTKETGFLIFYSRTKKRLWMKGETSGNFLNLINILHDCDNDTLLVLVNSIGFTCHLKKSSCFSYPYSNFLFLYKLESNIKEKKYNNNNNSYTKYLYNRGINRIVQKFGEESIEVVISSLKNNKKNLIDEASDLIYHFLVLLSKKNIKLHKIINNLYKRSIF